MENNHTEDFMHFKLYSDSTLNKFRKDDLITYIKILHKNWSGCDEQFLNVMNILQQYDKIEKELECPVEVIFKALKSDIYCLEDNKLLKVVPINVKYLNNGFFHLECDYDGMRFLVSVKDYKKTWWLNEDKNE